MKIHFNHWSEVQEGLTVRCRNEFIYCNQIGTIIRVAKRCKEGSLDYFVVMFALSREVTVWSDFTSFTPWLND